MRMRILKASLAHPRPHKHTGLHDFQKCTAEQHGASHTQTTVSTIVGKAQI